MARVAVAPLKFTKGEVGFGRVVPEVYEVLDVAEALEQEYKTDAHLVTCVLPGRRWQPRINKPSLSQQEIEPFIDVFFCDADNPGHVPWNEDLEFAAREDFESLDVLSTVGVYHTTRGRRFVQPIATPVRVSEAERYLRWWLGTLETAGLDVDWTCTDWTRHFRLPHVRREGRQTRAKVLDLSRMQPIELPVLPPVAPAPPRARRGRRAVAVPTSWTTDLPAPWARKVRRLAEAAATYSDGRHGLYLALAGALLGRSAPPEHLPAICRAVSLAAGNDLRTQDREAAGRSTVARYASGAPVQGYAALRRSFSAMADAVDDVFGTGLRMPAPTAPPRRQGTGAPSEPTEASTSQVEAPLPAAEAVARLDEAIARAPEGVTLIGSECGVGKTQAAIRAALARAAKTHTCPKATGARAPLKSKTGISVDKNALAIQVTRDLRAKGGSVRRLFGPLSIMQNDGETPECRYHRVALPLVEGGQSMQWEFCQGRGKNRCEYYEVCKARDGIEGPEDARICVGPHSLVTSLAGEIGSTGLLVIDEPPALVESACFPTSAFETTLRALSMFETRYALAMKPAVVALRAWIDSGAEATATIALDAALRTHVCAVTPSDLDFARGITHVKPSGDVVADVLACVAAAHEEGKRQLAPPIQPAAIYAARRSETLADRLGCASKLLGALHGALSSGRRVGARIEQAGGAWTLVLTAVREDMERALKRDGSTVVLDANVDVHAPVIEKIVGYAPPLHTFSVADGAPIARTVVQCSSATRSQWLPFGKLNVTGSLPRAVVTAFAWAREDLSTRRLGVISFRPLSLALEAAWRGNNDGVAEAWTRLGLSVDDLTAARSALSPVLDGWEGNIHFGHYGAVRGLDNFADVDAIITLGDPRPNLDAVRSDLEFLELGDAWEARVEALCRAELEQAHGRIRAIHRTRPGRALHIGMVVPGGSGWTRDAVEVRLLARGRRPNARAVPTDDVAALVVALGGVRAAAAAGVAVASLARYAKGERAAPVDVVERLKQALAVRTDAAPRVAPAS